MRIKQGAIEAYIMRALSLDGKLDNEQLIGFVMLNFGLFYDDAKLAVEKALNVIKVK